MRPFGRQKILFAAYSAIGAKAFINDRLISCPVLSKAPGYGQVLRRFILQLPLDAITPLLLLRIYLRYILTNAGHFLFLVMSACFLRLSGWQTPHALSASCSLVIIDTFALLPKIAAERSYAERYLPGLSEAAREHGHQPLYLYRFYGSRNPIVLWKAMKVLGAGGGGFFEAHLFTPGDWFRLIWHCLAYPVALFRLVRDLRPFAEGTAESYIRNALIKTAGQCILIGESRRIAALRLGTLLAARPVGAKAQVVSWYENQTVNKAFQRGLTQARKKSGRHVPVTGAQLFPWSPAFLNNHPDDEEVALGLTPDRVLVNGPFFLPEASRQTYAPGPSLRYVDVYAPFSPLCSRQDRLRESTGRTLLVLLPHDPEETRHVLAIALPLAVNRARERPVDRAWNVIYRFHPAADSLAFRALLPPKPVIAGQSLKASLEVVWRTGGAVLGSGSGSLAEAASLGVPVLVVAPVSGIPELDFSCLPEYGKGILWENVRHPAEVNAAFAGLQSRELERAQHARLFRDMLFTEPTRCSLARAFGLDL